MSSLAVNPLMPKMGPKPFIERAHYSAPGGAATMHSHSHSHSSSKGGKHSIALSALTLLSFLFFLNILQNCLDQHMDAMNSTSQQLIVIQAKNAENRKGDVEDSNESIEGKTGVEVKPTENYMSQIPVKLKTNSKP